MAFLTTDYDTPQRRLHLWHAVWQHAALTPPPTLFDDLERAWAQPQRHYHDLRHLAECLQWWQRWQGECEHPHEVALALWFHDAVYDPQAADNEQRSADWATRALGDAGLAAASVARIAALILLTQHHAQPQGPDAEVLCDIDLAILGAPPGRFAGYEADVRREYGWVDEPAYRAGRRAVLQRLRRLAPLYHRAPARALLQAQAERNLDAAIAALG